MGLQTAPHSMSRLEMSRQSPQSSQQHVLLPLKNQNCRQVLAPHKAVPTFRRQAEHKSHRRRRLGIHSQLQAETSTDRGELRSEVPTTSAAFSGVPQIWAGLADERGDQLAAIDPHQSPQTKLTFLELESQIIQFAAGLHALKLQAGDKVALFSENSSRWLVADQAVMTVGAADAVRGASSPAEEMAYIVRHSESCGIIAQDSATLERLAPALGGGASSSSSNGSNGSGSHGQESGTRFAIVLWGELSDKCRTLLDCPVLTFADVLAKGHRASATFSPQPLSADQLATIVYTSGTTGNPKGVMLSHANLRYQLDNLHFFLAPRPGDRSLSLLPPWHIYERSCGYFLYSRACTQVYTNIRKFKEDLSLYPPHHFVCVPLVLDTLYGRVQAQIKKGSAVKRLLARFFFAAGTAYVHARRIVEGVALQYAHRAPSMPRVMLAALTAAVLYPIYRLGQILVFSKIRAALGIMSTIISGGGSLAGHLDDFYEVLSLPVLNGWGLTETSPVLACRRSVPPRENVRGSVGLPIPGTQVRVVDPETLAPLSEGQKGLLLARGPGVMKGYFNDEAATAKAFSAGNGWFDTGDLGWRAPTGVAGSHMAGHIVLTGRAKDTIVLSSGENVEPGPIEDACTASTYIQHMVLLGQDQRMLGALVMPAKEAFDELESVKGKLSEDEIRAVIRSEISKATASRPHFERIAAFTLLKEPMSPENGTLTRTFKPRRAAIYTKYAKEVAEVQGKLRRV